MRFSRLALLYLLFLASASAMAQSANIFILHSYSQEYPWTKRQHEAFISGLRSGAHRDILFATEYLDTKRAAFEQEYIARFSAYLGMKYRGYMPDAIYVTDDNALDFAITKLRGIFPGSGVVFSGVNDYSVLERIDSATVTGVFEKKEIAPNLRILENTGAHRGKIAFVGDGSETYVAIRREIEHELARFPSIEPAFIAATNIDDISSRLAAFPYRAVFLTTIGGVRNAAGQRLTIPETIREINASGDFILLSMEDASQRIAGMGSWSLDLESGQLEWSDEIFQIFEIDRSRFSASYDAFLAVIHPDDRSMVNQAYLVSVDTNSGYEVQHRLLMPDGRIKYVLERGSTFYGSDGTPLRSVGTVQDVSERVRAAQRLQQWAAVFENSLEGVLITDEESRIIDVNRAFSEITGYGKEEVIGRRPNFRRSECHDDRYYIAMWERISTTGSWNGEIWNRKKNGELSPEWMSVSYALRRHR